VGRRGLPHFRVSWYLRRYVASVVVVGQTCAADPEQNADFNLAAFSKAYFEFEFNSVR
jgi:hypothetical protein